MLNIKIVVKVNKKYFKYLLLLKKENKTKLFMRKTRKNGIILINSCDALFQSIPFVLGESKTGNVKTNIQKIR